MCSQAYLDVSQRLLDERKPGGHWEGELSASALSTATAVFALFCAHQQAPADDLARLIQRGRDWLVRHQNADGGWGDTVDSPSNLSTTVLCWAALSAVGQAEWSIDRAEIWIIDRTGGLDEAALVPAIQAIYGDDQTFSIPILVMCALAGCLGEGTDAWRQIPQLPFELAVFPRRGYKYLGLPVVSYALPALIAIGVTQHHHRRSRLPPLGWLRDLCVPKTLRLLAEIQPESGGFLEAIPLTSFVTMSLARVPGSVDLPVIQRCVRFLQDSIRPDGSYPIDINLATWGTTLSVGALASSGLDLLPGALRRRLADWLLAQHHTQIHPFTLADPGGWAWTDLSGGVPDADDTAGALLALTHLAPDDPRAHAAAELAVGWLIDLQNRDGGIPTFCRGWGKLPFDRSSPDLTAHTLRAWYAWRGHLSADTRRRVDQATKRAISFLEHGQREDGSWVPLWFGNQAAPGNENPTYGTARVVLALAATELASTELATTARQRGVDWLLGAQNPDGGWGGAKGVASSVEETALALEALGAVRERWPTAEIEDVGRRGLAHLLERIEAGDLDRPAPIGLYFADLWYSEKLYPLCFSAAALKRWA